MNSKTKTNEAIELYSINYLAYIIFIDATSIYDSGKGSLSYLLPNIEPPQMKNIFEDIFESEKFKINYEKMKGIHSRFIGDSVIKALLKTLYKLMSMSPSEDLSKMDPSKKDKDISLVVKKIGTYISGKLTSSDKLVFQDIASEINSVSKQIYNTINQQLVSQLDTTHINPEPPANTKKQANERLKNKFKKKLKELARNVIISRSFGKK